MKIESGKWYKTRAQDCPDGWVLVPKRVVEDIKAISNEYRRQVEERGYFDTPGGIENPQDAFDYINDWAEAIPAAPVAGKGE
ncbi:MAG: hypothetical protein E6R04_06420 [Spirochaetes bacterium]|nr:MAG: hypothetical protein E6R04_06420 [Spirochaetota bacterium]